MFPRPPVPMKPYPSARFSRGQAGTFTEVLTKTNTIVTSRLPANLRRERRHHGDCLRPARRHPQAAGQRRGRAGHDQQSRCWATRRSDVRAIWPRTPPCILLDPDLRRAARGGGGSLPATWRCDRARRFGLRHRSRRPLPLEAGAGITARRVRELGGTGGKLMVYLRADHPDANAPQREIIRDCIADFAAEDCCSSRFLTYHARRGAGGLQGEIPVAHRRRQPHLPGPRQQGAEDPLSRHRGKLRCRHRHVRRRPGPSCRRASTMPPSSARSNAMATARRG